MFASLKKVFFFLFKKVNFLYSRFTALILRDFKNTLCFNSDSYDIGGKNHNVKFWAWLVATTITTKRYQLDSCPEKNHRLPPQAWKAAERHCWKDCRATKYKTLEGQYKVSTVCDDFWGHLSTGVAHSALSSQKPIQCLPRDFYSTSGFLPLTGFLDMAISFAAGLRTCPQCQNYFQLVCWPWFYCAWLACQLPWPEPH